MKRIVLSLASFIVASSSFAAEVKSARLSANGKNLEVDVFYGGGCKEHNFTLQVGGCLESFPVQCGVELVDNTHDDFCEALVGKTVVFSLKKYGLTDSYYSGARLSINGDNETSATVILPR